MWRRPSGHRRISTVNPQTTTALTALNPLTSKNKLNVTRWACLICEKSVEICGICGRQISAQCAKEQAECIYSPTDPADFHRCHADWWGLNGFPHYETRAISFSPRNRLAAFSPFVYDKKLLEFVRVQQLHYRFIRYQIPSLAQVA